MLSKIEWKPLYITLSNQRAKGHLISLDTMYNLKYWFAGDILQIDLVLTFITQSKLHFNFRNKIFKDLVDRLIDEK